MIPTLRRAIGLAALLTMLAPAGRAQTRPLRGTWSATGAGQTLQGTWTAQEVPGRPDAVQGTWTLVNDARQTVTGGTWSAAKNARAWSGSWQARIVTRGNANGRVLSGTWRADAPGSPDVKTLLDLLRTATDTPASGTWSAAGRSGRWSLRATP